MMNEHKEAVKVVKGIAITRRIGTRGYYEVTLENLGGGCRKYVSFKTIKAAAEYIEKHF